MCERCHERLGKGHKYLPKSRHSSETLKTPRRLNMISVWLLFQALWQWVGEKRLHSYSPAVLQHAVTVPVCLWRYTADT